MTNSIRIGLQFPLESATLAASYLRTVLRNEEEKEAWGRMTVHGIENLTDEQASALDIDVGGMSSLVFNNAAGVLWSLTYLPSALTATERAAIVLALVPTTDAKTLAANANDAIQNINEMTDSAFRLASTAEEAVKAQIKSIQESLQAMANAAGAIAVVKENVGGLQITPMARRTRNTSYLCPEAAKMYRDMLSACNASTGPYKRFMCVEWRNDYKAFERFFLDRNMRERADRPKHFIPHHEGIICTRLNDPESTLHGAMVYGPTTVMFVSKSNQNFYNRNKRDFLTRLAEHVSKGTISEKEAEFMRKREQV